MYFISRANIEYWWSSAAQAVIMKGMARQCFWSGPPSDRRRLPTWNVVCLVPPQMLPDHLSSSSPLYYSGFNHLHCFGLSFISSLLTTKRQNGLDNITLDRLIKLIVKWQIQGWYFPSFVLYNLAAIYQNICADFSDHQKKNCQNFTFFQHMHILADLLVTRWKNIP